METQEGNIVLEHANIMADIFEKNYRYFGGEVYVSNEGLEALADYFNTVELELRAPVFEWFIVELNNRDIEYDTNWFGGTA